MNFVIATISFILNVAGDLPDLQDYNNNNSNNNSNNNNNNNNNNSNNNNNINNNTSNNNKIKENNTYKFKTFSSFLFICKKCFAKHSYLVCFVHVSDIKSNWRPGIQLVCPVQFFLS